MTEKLWFIAPHPINKEEGFTPPKRTVHPYKYEHERACADVFVTLMRGDVYAWEQHKKIANELIPDRTVYLTEDFPTYIEVELQDRDRVTEKLSRYQAYFRETRKPFFVLFIVKRLRDWKAPSSYSFELLENFVPKEITVDVPDAGTEEI